ncbi:nucleotidyltransferase family protein [Azotobacter vinelandii]|uniref:nucleotidyltransferase family protein n=1 Tax=Azotobacter vinelandii TaxID=354 RepID=UPI000773999C|nr:nucleotidyltransferase domain-containing protein [Azotobacter vinelandii]
MPRLEADRLCLEPRHLALLQDLLRQHVPGAEVWAYGSRASGGAHETSDLDLVLRNPVDSDRTVEGLAALREALQASSLPILVEVHPWPALPETFQREIERVYVVIQEGGGSLER